jgi:predicted RNA-binding Zn ribbon-like protein
MADSRPAPFFIADDAALDFLNSIAVPWGDEIEWLTDGTDFIAWLELARLVPPEAAARVRAQAGTRALDAVAGEARELREWFRSFVARHSRRPLARRALQELALLNEVLERDDLLWQIEAARPDTADRDGHEPRALRWRTERRWDNPRALLLPIAHAMGALVCEKDFSFVRQCEGQGCTLWFLDVSKTHARRWCSMAVCGNRAKAAAHRARTRKSPV